MKIYLFISFSLIQIILLKSASACPAIEGLFRCKSQTTGNKLLEVKKSGTDFKIGKMSVIHADHEKHSLDLLIGTPDEDITYTAFCEKDSLIIQREVQDLPGYLDITKYTLSSPTTGSLEIQYQSDLNPDENLTEICKPISADPKETPRNDQTPSEIEGDQEIQSSLEKARNHLLSTDFLQRALIPSKGIQGALSPSSNESQKRIPSKKVMLKDIRGVIAIEPSDKSKKTREISEVNVLDESVNQTILVHPIKIPDDEGCIGLCPVIPLSTHPKKQNVQLKTQEGDQFVWNPFKMLLKGFRYRILWNTKFLSNGFAGGHSDTAWKKTLSTYHDQVELDDTQKTQKMVFFLNGYDEPIRTAAYRYWVNKKQVESPKTIFLGIQSHSNILSLEKEIASTLSRLLNSPQENHSETAHQLDLLKEGLKKGDFKLSIPVKDIEGNPQSLVVYFRAQPIHEQTSNKIGEITNWTLEFNEKLAPVEDSSSHLFTKIQLDQGIQLVQKIEKSLHQDSRALCAPDGKALNHLDTEEQESQALIQKIHSHLDQLKSYPDLRFNQVINRFTNESEIKTLSDACFSAYLTEKALSTVNTGLKTQLKLLDGGYTSSKYEVYSSFSPQIQYLKTIALIDMTAMEKGFSRIRAGWTHLRLLMANTEPMNLASLKKRWLTALESVPKSKKGNDPENKEVYILDIASQWAIENADLNSLHVAQLRDSLEMFFNLYHLRSNEIEELGIKFETQFLQEYRDASLTQLAEKYIKEGEAITAEIKRRAQFNDYTSNLKKKDFDKALKRFMIALKNPENSDLKVHEPIQFSFYLNQSEKEIESTEKLKLHYAYFLLKASFPGFLHEAQEVLPRSSFKLTSPIDLENGAVNASAIQTELQEAVRSGSNSLPWGGNEISLVSHAIKHPLTDFKEGKTSFTVSPKQYFNRALAIISSKDAIFEFIPSSASDLTQGLLISIPRGKSQVEEAIIKVNKRTKEVLIVSFTDNLPLKRHQERLLQK